MDARITLPNSGRRTSPLGVGLATLMREASAARRQRLLHAAYEAGFRHFDVAPSYGLGAAEAVLGRFLRTRPGDFTIGTKVGIVARGNRRLVRIVERPARLVLKFLPGLRGRATKSVGGIVHKHTDFSIRVCERSLDDSLRALGVDAIDVYLLHDAQPEDVADGVLAEWLDRQKARGVIRAAGVASSPGAVSAIMRAQPTTQDVAQIPSDIFKPGLIGVSGIAPKIHITHSTLTAALPHVSQAVRNDDGLASRLSERLGADARSPGVLARMLLATAVVENRNGIVLVGTSREQHLRDAAAAVDAFPADRLAAAGAVIRSSLGQA